MAVFGMVIAVRVGRGNREQIARTGRGKLPAIGCGTVRTLMRSLGQGGEP